MKIGIDCRLWNETGVGRYIRNLVLNLQKLDHKNDYVLFVLSKDAESIRYKVLSSKYKSWRIVIADIRWHTLEEQLRFPSILNKEKLDLMHFPYFSVPLFYSRPFVVTIHDLIIDHFPTGRASTLPLPLYYLKRLGYKKVLSNAVTKAKKIIVPLFCVKDDLVKTLKIPENKICVTLEGFDSSIAKGNISGFVSKVSYGKYFLYVGNAYPHKNLETLLAGFNNLKSNDIKLLLVGRNDFFYNRLEKKANKDIIFLHDVSDADLFHLYSRSVAAVSASLMEGFGLFPLEALKIGTVPVVSDIPAFREVCANLAIYFNPYDKDDLTEKLKQVLMLGDIKREEIKQKAKNVLGKFSWQKMAKETLKIYNSL